MVEQTFLSADEDRRSAERSPSLPNRTGAINASGFPVSGLVAQTNLRKSRPEADRRAAPATTVFTAVDSVSRAVDWIGSDPDRDFASLGV